MAYLSLSLNSLVMLLLSNFHVPEILFFLIIGHHKNFWKVGINFNPFFAVLVLRSGDTGVFLLAIVFSVTNVHTGIHKFYRNY